MKKIILLKLILVLSCFAMLAQTPQAFNYQAVARNAAGELVANQSIGVQVSLLQGSVTGIAVYSETHLINSDNYGVINFEIGSGTPVGSMLFSNVDWSNGSKFIKIEMDISGSNNYQHLGTFKLFSVPYALYSQTAEEVIGTITESQISDLDHFTNADEIDPIFAASPASGITNPDINSWNNKLDTEIDGSTTNELQSISQVLSVNDDAGNLAIVNVSQQGIGTSTPNGSAALEINSIMQGFLPPRMTKSQMNNITNAVEGLMVYCTDCTPKSIRIFDGNLWTKTNGYPELEEGEVYNPATGKIWMDRNLGAQQVAASMDDPDAYGDLFQWGRLEDGHEQRTSGNTATLSPGDNPGHSDFIIIVDQPRDWRTSHNNNLWQGVNGINNPCPAGFRLPTVTEWQEETATWSSQDAAGAFESPLKLTLNGLRSYGSGSVFNYGIYGYGAYWSSSTSNKFGRTLTFNNSAYFNIGYGYRAGGHAVRCIKD
jgi:uncharacterized protein (TIGR02145 family)